MDLAPLIPIVAILAFAGIKIARINATRTASASPEIATRVEELERLVEGLQKELSETQERLDFAERLLAQGRDERRIGG
jgi:predicted  nucleic acid-binding Zn-ribbon protein